jgi:ankyrin repeat protein
MADPTTPNRPPFHRLVDLCLESRFDEARMLDADPLLLNARNGTGETPLHFLAVENAVDSVRWLAARGAEINTFDFRDSPLTGAALVGSLETMRFLLDSGADLDHQDEGGWTALIAGSHAGEDAVVELLLERGANLRSRSSIEQTALHLAASQGHETVASQLIKAGAEVDALEFFDFRPLHSAAMFGHDGVARLLIANGANRRALCDREKPPCKLTPGDIAAESGHIALAEWLNSLPDPEQYSQ